MARSTAFLIALMTEIQNKLEVAHGIVHELERDRVLPPETAVHLVSASYTVGQAMVHIQRVRS